MVCSLHSPALTVFSSITDVSSAPLRTSVLTKEFLWLLFVSEEMSSHPNIQEAARVQTHIDPLKCPGCPPSQSHFFLCQVLWFLAWDAPVISLSAHLVMFEG